MAEPVDLIVRRGDCPCPGAIHSEEHVYLEPELTLPMGMAGLASLQGTVTPADVEAALAAAWFPLGIVSWSFVEKVTDGKGTQPVPVTRESLARLVPFSHGGLELVQKGGELWMPEFEVPFDRERATQSPPGSTDNSTPPSPESGTPSPTPLRRSTRNASDGKPFEAPVL